VKQKISELGGATHHSLSFLRFICPHYAFSFFSHVEFSIFYQTELVIFLRVFLPFLDSLFFMLLDMLDADL